MTDVFDVLTKDHAEVIRMLAELEKGPTNAAGATGDQLLLRKKMTEELIIEESKHEALEEMYFWPAVREHVEGGDALADEATGLKHEGEEILGKLDKTDASAPDFEKLLATFIQAGRKHIRFQETRVWPRLRMVLPAGAADELGTKIAESKKTAATSRGMD